MTAQSWIDHHHSLLPIVFPIYFVLLWLLVSACVSWIGGWSALARVYRAQVPFVGTKWTGQSAQGRWWMNYNNVLTIGLNAQGLYLAMMFLFRFRHPALLIPWSDIKVRRSQGWIFE